MAEMEYKLSAKGGAIAAAAGIGIVIVRLATVGEVDDSKLDAAIAAELRNDLAPALVRAGEDGDEDVSPESFDEGIRILSTKVSKPLLSVGSKTDAIVRLEYRLLDDPPRTEYWRFEHSAIAGWRYRRGSSKLSYYLNFI